MAWFAFVVSADVCHAGVDLGRTNMASHKVGFVNSVGVVLGHWVFGPILVQVASLALGFVLDLASCSVLLLASCSLLGREEKLH